jgi:hypothetical protein
MRQTGEEAGSFGFVNAFGTTHLHPVAGPIEVHRQVLPRGDHCSERAVCAAPDPAS